MIEQILVKKQNVNKNNFDLSSYNLNFIYKQFAMLGKAAPAKQVNNNDSFLHVLGALNPHSFLISPTNADEVYCITKLI